MGIREILASAQQAEIRGDLEEAVRLLTRAADFYRARQLTARAAQMERHVRRLRGEEEPVEAPADSPEQEPVVRELSPFERGPQLADPAIDAWCSFCCRPKQEVGPLIAGPAGAYICARCTAAAAALLGG